MISIYTCNICLCNRGIGRNVKFPLPSKYLSSKRSETDRGFPTMNTIEWDVRPSDQIVANELKIAINTRCYMQFWMQIMHTREQCIGYHLELRSYRLKSRLKNLRKFERRSVLSTLQLFVEEKVLTCLFSCNFEIANLPNKSHLQTSASF